MNMYSNYINYGYFIEIFDYIRKNTRKINVKLISLQKILTTKSLKVKDQFYFILYFS